MTLSIWFAHLYAGTARWRRVAQAAGIIGAVGITLGAALASLLGRLPGGRGRSPASPGTRGEFRVKALCDHGRRRDRDHRRRARAPRRTTSASCGRGSATHDQSQPAGAEHGSWSQRLIFAYIGGRIFLANPVVGTGWYPELPPKEYARFLPDTHRRYPLQPADLFPPADGKFIPQMTYDQVLYELGAAGALVFLLLLAATVRDSLRSARGWPRGSPDSALAYVAATWTASMIGVLAGIALFGGTTVAALFWLTLGAVAALAAVSRRAEPGEARPTLGNAADTRCFECRRGRAGRDLRRRARRARASGSTCTVRLRGNQLTLEGDDQHVENARAVIDELVELVEGGHQIGSHTVDAVLGTLEAGQDVRDVFDAVVWRHRGKKIAPKTVTQKEYVDLIRRSTVTFGIGPAGTGKTYLAMAMAVAALHEREVSRIILTRPAVEAGERLGFLPGDLMAKVDPYLRPLFDALYDMLDPDKALNLIERGTIEVAPLAFMRGRTLNDSFIILDEAQNTSPEQMQMFLTRLGFGSKVVVTGDVTQIDLPREQRSGLVHVRDVLVDIEGISYVEFGHRDVVRHKLVQRIVEAYKEHTEERNR